MIKYALLLILIVSVPNFAIAKDGEDLSRLEQLVDSSSFEEGKKLALIIEEKASALSKKERVKFLHFKSRIESAYNLTGHAKKLVAQIYDLDPDYRLDPVKDLPEVFDYYESLRISPAQVEPVQ